MSSGTQAAPLQRPVVRPRLGGALLSRGIITMWLSIIVLAPIIALTLESFDGGVAEFWDEVTLPRRSGSFASRC